MIKFIFNVYFCKVDLKTDMFKWHVIKSAPRSGGRARKFHVRQISCVSVTSLWSYMKHGKSVENVN